MADDIVVVVPAAHPWHGRAEISIEELRSEPLLIRERGSGTRAALERALADVRLDLGAFRVVGEMGSTQAIKQAVRANVGVSIVSRRAVNEECRSGAALVPARRRPHDRALLLPGHPQGAEPLALGRGVPRLRGSRGHLKEARPTTSVGGALARKAMSRSRSSGGSVICRRRAAASTVPLYVLTKATQGGHAARCHSSLSACSRGSAPST